MSQSNAQEEAIEFMVLKDLIIKLGTKSKRSFGNYDESSLKSLIKYLLIQKEYKQHYQELWRSQELTNLVILGNMLLNDETKDI